MVLAAEHFWWEHSFLNLAFALVGRKPTPAAQLSHLGYDIAAVGFCQHSSVGSPVAAAPQPAQLR